MPNHVPAGGPIPVVPAGTNLVSNSGFDLKARTVPSWSAVPTSQIPGWESSTGRIEIWRNGFLGYQSPSGGYIVELDGDRRQDTIFQEVETEAGRIYEIKVVARARTAGSSDFSIGWGGETQTTVSPSTGEWQEYKVRVPGDGGAVSLSISEIPGQNNSLGALIDTVEIVATDEFI